MDKNNKFQHGFKLRVNGLNEPSIFLWPVLPDNILDLQVRDSGGTDVTVKLPNNENVTYPVLESIDEIKQRIAKCRKLDDLSHEADQEA